MKLELLPELKGLFANQDPFAVIEQQPGEVFRQLEQRKTQSFSYKNKNYFFKLHSGMSWAECFKNLLQGKLPVISAINAWRALNLMQQNGVAVARPVAYADQMGWPPTRRSFIVMSAIENFIDLENLVIEGRWKKLNRSQQDKLIIEVARMTQAMHKQGINHRDCYLCHFLLDKNWLDDTTGLPMISMIDFHRARIKSPIVKKWLIKDLGALYYSAMNTQLSQRQAWLFIKTYGSYESITAFKKDISMWRLIVEKAQSIYQRDFNKPGRQVFK